MSRNDGGMEAPSGGPDARTLTVAALCIEALLSLAVWVIYDPSVAGWQLRVDLPWLSDLGATISLGVDGLSLPMVVMTALVLPLAYLGSWQNVRVRTPAFGALALMLTTGLIGVFLTIDLLAFYVAWELMLIPTYFLIGVWGTNGQARASLRYVLFTLVGSLLMLVAIVSLWTVGGSTSFHLDHLMAQLLTPRTLDAQGPAGDGASTSGAADGARGRFFHLRTRGDGRSGGACAPRARRAAVAPAQRTVRTFLTLTISPP
jgi:NADH-quinone oxidoreductase subunit M